MSQLIEFATRHSPLVLSAVLLAIAATALEIWRRTTGSRAVAPNEAVRLMNRENALVLDLRSAAAFEKAHIASAKHAPPDHWPAQLAALLPKSLSTDTPILLIAAAGEPPYRLAKLLGARGFRQCFHLQNGFQGWQAAGLPVTQ